MNAEMMKCDCGATPILTNNGEAVFVECECCGRRGPALSANELGALMRARLAWNHQAPRRLNSTRTRRSSRPYRAPLVPHAIAALLTNTNR